jgi:hypothetical protein
MLTVNQIQEQFKTPEGQVALAYHVPMEMLEEVRLAYRQAGIKIRAVYRGPRRRPTPKWINEGNSFTLKTDSTSFSVYAVYA